MSLKIQKIADTSKPTVMASLIPDLKKFQEQVGAALENLQIMLSEHFTRVQLMEKLNAIEDPDGLVKLFDTVSVLPHDGLQKIAEYVDIHYRKETDHIKVLLYLEISKSTVRGAQEYVNEQCRQRMQAIARQQALIVKPKLIVP